MTKSTYRGHDIEYYDIEYYAGYWFYRASGGWFYCDTGESVQKTYKTRPCGHCDKPITKEGHDGCLGTIPGARNACCGHGEINMAYIQFQDMFCIRGQAAIDIFELHRD